MAQPTGTRAAHVSPQSLPAPLTFAVTRLAGGGAILLVIAYMTLLGLLMADRGRSGTPVNLAAGAGEALGSLVTYLTQHPAEYYWSRQLWPAAELVLTFFGRSAGLLVLAMGMAALVGIPLGVLFGMARGNIAGTLVLSASVLGTSTPSFLLGMLFWVVDFQLYNTFGVAPLPPTGFGWDEHVILPALVLAARPLAQVVQITYVSLADVMGRDFIRTAHAKGLRRRWVILRHALRNVLVPVLNTLGASLRFSLASLPVVEVFFVWPGVGYALWRAIGAENNYLVTDVIVLLGLFFLLVNAGLDALMPIIAPNTRQSAVVASEADEGRTSLRDWLTYLRERLAGSLTGLGTRARSAVAAARRPAGQEISASEPAPAAEARRQIMRRALTSNLMLWAGGLTVLALFAVAGFGARMAAVSPYETHGLMHIAGELAAPPFKPSVEFPWGSDPVGRDVQALVLTGARQTLTMALIATLARLLLGATLGTLAGWWRGSALDRVVTSAVAVWAAFPVTLFAMILIQAMGIQEGMPVFVIALCVVGWGEIAQLVRAEVIRVRPQLFVEAAHSIGARASRIVTQHILPQLGPALLVLAVLEMGSVLMLLAELGFLNVFLGGGFKAVVGEGANMAPIVYYYSDVPEWAALLANIRLWWRSYPWMAWYPGLCFFVAILGFNLAGEGLRRFLDETRLNIGRLFNRYSLGAAGVVVLVLFLALRSNTPLEMYRPTVDGVDAARAMADVAALSSPAMQGRETGRPGSRLAAEYIAQRMEQNGLQPAGDGDTFIQSYSCPRYHLAGLPTLSIVRSPGVTETLQYRRDFVEYARPLSQATVELNAARLVSNQGEMVGRVTGLALGALPEGTRDVYGLGKLGLTDSVLIMLEGPAEPVATYARSGVLIVADDPADLQRRILPSTELRWRENRGGRWPVMYITPELADRLLASAGSSVADLRARSARLQNGQAELTAQGAEISMSVPVEPDDIAETCYNVIGYLPGSAGISTAGAARGLDSRVIVVSAYYDGVGVGPDGTVYPGANDNASGVAAMLETARVLKESPYQPKKTVVFVAWAEGERGAGLSLSNVMNAKAGFGLLTVEAVLELSGMGGGDGSGVALAEGSSFRLVQLYEAAAGRVGLATTTRGRGPHFASAARAGFGGRSALSLFASWDGADRLAHTTGDVPSAMDPDKLRRSTQASLLTLMVVSREVDY